MEIDKEDVQEDSENTYDDKQPARMIITLLLTIILFVGPFAAWITGRDLPVPF